MQETQEGPLGFQGWVNPIPVLTPETTPSQSAHTAFWGKVMEAEKVLAQHKAEIPQTLPQLRQQIIRSIRSFESISGVKLSSLGLVRHTAGQAEILQVTTEVGMVWNGKEWVEADGQPIDLREVQQ